MTDLEINRQQATHIVSLWTELSVRDLNNIRIDSTVIDDHTLEYIKKSKLIGFVHQSMIDVVRQIFKHQEVCSLNIIEQKFIECIERKYGIGFNYLDRDDIRRYYYDRVKSNLRRLIILLTGEIR